MDLPEWKFLSNYETRPCITRFQNELVGQIWPRLPKSKGKGNRERSHVRIPKRMNFVEFSFNPQQLPLSDLESGTHNWIPHWLACLGLFLLHALSYPGADSPPPSPCYISFHLSDYMAVSSANTWPASTHSEITAPPHPLGTHPRPRVDVCEVLSPLDTGCFISLSDNPDRH